MNSPKVSVIVPVYKVPLEYLRVYLDSLIKQSKKAANSFFQKGRCVFFANTDYSILY